MRSAGAFGFKQIIALKGTAALWSPKVLRAGMGAHFDLRLVEAVSPEALEELALPLLVTGIEPPIPIVLVLWSLCGAAQAFLIPVMTFTTLLTPNEARGRVVGIAAAGFALFTTLGYLATGWVATLTSPAFAVVVMAVLGLAVAAIAYLLWPAASLRADIRRLEAVDV